jgi:hypothetical protein
MQEAVDMIVSSACQASRTQLQSFFLPQAAARDTNASDPNNDLWAESSGRPVQAIIQQTRTTWPPLSPPSVKDSTIHHVETAEHWPPGPSAAPVVGGAKAWRVPVSLRDMPFTSTYRNSRVMSQSPGLLSMYVWRDMLSSTAENPFEETLNLERRDSAFQKHCKRWSTKLPGPSAALVVGGANAWRLLPRCCQMRNSSINHRCTVRHGAFQMHCST